jgi:hypothetical protein
LETFTLEKPADFVDGPIFTFLGAAPSFDRLVLLYNPPLEKNGAVAALAEDLRCRYPATQLKTLLLPIPRPTDYEALYKGMRTACEETRAEYGAYSGELDRAFRPAWTGDSGPSGPPIPVDPI